MMTKEEQMSISNAMEEFIRRRIWDSDDLLEGFDESEVDVIIESVVQKHFNKICDYVRDIVELETRNFIIANPQHSNLSKGGVKYVHIGKRQMERYTL